MAFDGTALGAIAAMIAVHVQLMRVHRSGMRRYEAEIDALNREMEEQGPDFWDAIRGTHPPVQRLQ